MKQKLEKIRTHVPRLVGEDRIFRSAVCIPLIEREDSFDVLFEVRAAKNLAQPGDICLPGGKIEAGEEAADAAKRELMEELLVDEHCIEIIGRSDIFHTESTIVYPYVGLLKNYEGTFNREVSEVFTVPLSFFLETEPELYKITYEVCPCEDFPYDRINGGRDYKWRGRETCQLFYNYEGRNIWGLTAKIMHAFAEVVNGTV